MKKILASKEYVNITIEEKINNLSASGFSGSWNDLTDKPFYEEGSGATIEWDGSTEGRDSFVAEATYYHVSDSTPTIDELIGASYETDMVYSGVSATSITSEMLTVFGDCIAISAGVPLIIIATIDNAATGDSETKISKAGVYFINASGYGYASKLTYGSTTIKTLDEKFIPDTIARVSDIPTFPEINYPVTSVNGQTGAVVIDIPSTEGLATEEYVNSAITNINTYYTKAEIDNMEFITLDEIDAICARTIEVVTPTSGTF